MNASYKIALLAAVGLLVLVVGYYATRGPGPDNLTQLNPDPTLDADAQGEAADDADTGETPARRVPELAPSPRRTTPDDTQPPARRTPPARTAEASEPGASAVVEIGPPPTDPNTTLGNPVDVLQDGLDALEELRAARAESTPAIRATPEPAETTATLDPTPEATPPAETTPEATPAPEPTPVVETPATRPERAARGGVPATYTVQPGDMLVHIAERYYGSQAAWEDIAQANPTVDPTRLRVGQELRLPAPAVAERTRTEPPAPRPGTRERYTVKPGDNLTRIAERFYGDADKWGVIYSHNRDAIGPDPGRLKAGMTLDIPPAVAGAN